MAKKSLVSKKKTYLTEDKYIKYILLALISVFIIIIPFYRGLFFRENYMPAIAFISLLYFAYLVYKLLHKDYKIIDTYLDLAVLAIPICYFISFLFGVNAKDGLDAVLIYASYFMIYRIASEITKNDEKKKNILLNLIIASTFITAFTSVLALSDFITPNGVIVDSRLFGLYQYTNTTASVFAIGIILTIGMLINTTDIKYKLAYQIVLTTLISNFAFILSRGAFVILAGILLLNFILIKTKFKLRFVVNFFISLLSNLFLVYKYFTNGQAEFEHILANYVLSLVICIGLTVLFHILSKNLFKSINEKAINIVLIGVIIVLIIVIIFLLSVKEPIEYRIEHRSDEEQSWKYESFYINDVEAYTDYTIDFDVKSSLENPNSYGLTIRSYNLKEEFKDIFNEFKSVGQNFEHKSIDFTTLEDTDKIQVILYNYETNTYTIYKNIMLKNSYGEIVKKQDRYKYIPDFIANRLSDINLETQSASYRITFAKDGMEIIKGNVLIGAGGGGWKNLYHRYQSMPYDSTETHNFFIQYTIEVGLVGLLALVALIIQLFIGFAKNIRRKSNYLYVYLAVLLVFLHSTIDFNLSLVAVSYILWLLIGIINTDSNIKQITLLKNKWLHMIPVAFSIVILVSSSSIAYAIRLGNKAAIIRNSDLDRSIRLYENAMKYDRFNSDYRADYAQIMNNKFKETRDTKYYNSMLKQIANIKKYEPYNYKYMPVLVNLLISNGMLDEAVAMADDKLKNEPMVGQSYAINIDLNYEIAKYFFENGQHEKAIPYLKNMIKVKEEYDKRNSKVIKPIALPEGFDMKTDLALNWIEQANKIKK